jgi:glycosyltransferase involved in cell wall biosynthesis
MESAVHDTQGPLFSIITVCLNAEDHITEALRSVSLQDHGSFELLVVDGGSTDGTLEIIRGFESDFGARMRWTSEPDSGLYDAMNKGLRASRGRYVVYLGADDRLAPDALRVVERVLQEYEWPDIVAGSVRVFGGATQWVEQPRSYASRRMPKRAPVRHQSIFVSRQVLLEVGGFDTGYRVAADYELYLRLLKSGVREILIPDTLSEFGLGGISSSHALRTAREYRDVRVAHGANRVWQQLVMAKSVVAAKLVGAARGVGRADRGTQ